MRDKQILNYRVVLNNPKTRAQKYLKEYYQANKEQIAERAKEYYQANTEQIKERAKEYKETNMEQLTERRKQKIACECGSNITRHHISRHKQTAVHLNFTQVNRA
jgi:esterase/lipase